VGAPRNRGSLVIVAMLAGAFAPRLAVADEAAAVPAWLTETTVNAFVESSYGYNFNRPGSHLDQFRVFDFDDNTFKVDVFELVLQHAAMKPRDAGFRVDVAAGGSIPRVSAASGLFRDAAGNAEDVDLQQAYVSWVAPVGSGLRIDLGKFVTPAGYEVIEGYDGWNENATRSLLFGFAIPFTHNGARASATFSPRVSAMLMVVNGWDVATDDNSSKTVGAQLALTPANAFALTLTGIAGDERAEGDLRLLWDGVATFDVSPRLRFALNGDWATDAHAAANGDDAKWSGAAAYVRFGASRSHMLTVRGEFFADPDGVRTGVAQHLAEVTVTPDLRLSEHLRMRVDGRIDRSNRRVFDEEGTKVVKSQPTVLLSAVYAF